MSPAAVERYWAADVIIVGAGASGLVAAMQLVAAGFSVVIVEKQSVGSAQSNHSHGYMHRGHIYLKPSSSLVENLGRGADEWQSMMRQADISPITETSFLGFVNSYDAEVAERSWNASGLSFSTVSVPRSLSTTSFQRIFETQEQTYDFTSWLSITIRSLVHEKGVTLLQGSVTGLERDGQRVTGVVLEGRDKTTVLSSSYVVLCAGIGNLKLASSITHFRGFALNRTSLMLVVENPNMEKISFFARGHESRGLSVASRSTDSGTTWLVSNYVSYATEEITPTAVNLWIRDVRRSLETYTHVLENPDSRWGYYIAPKGELRSFRNVLNIQGVQRYGLDNLCVASPTKLTLVPLLAELIAETVSTKLRAAPRPAGIKGAEPSMVEIPVAEEMWKSAGLSSIRSLMAL